VTDVLLGVIATVVIAVGGWLLWAWWDDEL